MKIKYSLRYIIRYNNTNKGVKNMRLEDLQKNIEHAERQIRDLDRELEELERDKKNKEMYISIYGAILHYLTKDWECDKPRLEEFMKINIEKNAYDFWSRHKDLFDVNIVEGIAQEQKSEANLSEIEWTYYRSRLW